MGQDSLKFCTAILNGIAILCAGYVITIALSTDQGYIQKKDRPFYMLCVLEMIIGIVLPYLYITGKPNLKGFTYNRLMELKENILDSLPKFPSVFTNRVIPEEGVVSMTGLSGTQPQITITLP